MKIQKKKILLLILILLLVAVAAGILWYRNTHIFIGDHAYPSRATSLDLRGTGITIEEYEALTAALPECDITWQIPFQGSLYAEETQKIAFSHLTMEEKDILHYFSDLERIDATGCTDYPLLMEVRAEYPNAELLYDVTIDGQSWPQNASELTVTALTDDDISLMQYLFDLKTVDASACTDLDQLKKLQEAYPHLTVFYSVPVCGESYDRFTTQLNLEHADGAELMALVGHMPNLETVTITEPAGQASDLIALADAYPDVHFSWTREVLGHTITSSDTEVDLSGTTPESLEAIAEDMAWFPAVEKLILCDLGYDHETMAAFREKMRPEYKVVWNIIICELEVRTDDIYYMPSKFNKVVTQDEAYLLKYMEDLICIDVGHRAITTCEWAAYMPNLQYLVLADTAISDISPLAGLDKLVFLEIFITNVTDYSPLLTCTALEDLNISFTKGDPEPLKQMTWLKRLWWADAPVTEEEMRPHLPGVEFFFWKNSSTGGTWRQGQRYYEMRDILGMHYMWG